MTSSDRAEVVLYLVAHDLARRGMLPRDPRAAARAIRAAALTAVRRRTVDALPFPSERQLGELGGIFDSIGNAWNKIKGELERVHRRVANAFHDHISQVAHMALPERVAKAVDDSLDFREKLQAEGAKVVEPVATVVLTYYTAGAWAAVASAAAAAGSEVAKDKQRELQRRMQAEETAARAELDLLQQELTLLQQQAGIV